MNKKKLFRIVISALILIILSGYLYWQNNAIVVSHYDHLHPNIPQPFNDFKIVQVSDLHNKDFGSKLTDMISEEDPDIIVVTGDVIDRNRTNIPVAIEAMADMVEIAPVYFVSGNHEVASGEYDVLREEMNDIGVVNLDHTHETITIEDTEIGLVGIEDPLLILLEDIETVGSSELLINLTIEQLIEETGANFNILLSHRAEIMDIYAESGVDLALTGHAHGGQIRIPLVNGVFAPSQGFFPEYTSGIYEQNDTQMIVSRGLGNSIFPFRINNRPELVVVTLSAQ